MLIYRVGNVLYSLDKHNLDTYEYEIEEVFHADGRINYFKYHFFTADKMLKLLVVVDDKLYLIVRYGGISNTCYLADVVRNIDNDVANISTLGNYEDGYRILIYLEQVKLMLVTVDLTTMNTTVKPYGLDSEYGLEKFRSPDCRMLYITDWSTKLYVVDGIIYEVALQGEGHFQYIGSQQITKATHPTHCNILNSHNCVLEGGILRLIGKGGNNNMTIDNVIKYEATNGNIVYLNDSNTLNVTQITSNPDDKLIRPRMRFKILNMTNFFYIDKLYFIVNGELYCIKDYLRIDNRGASTYVVDLDDTRVHKVLGLDASNIYFSHSSQYDVILNAGSYTSMKSARS